MTKNKQHITDKVQNRTVREILRSVQEHDIQLTPLALDKICTYIHDLEEKNDIDD